MQRAETLWDVALRGIGIQLPDEYVLRFCALTQKVNQLGIDNVTLTDLSEIEYWARHEMEKRIKKIGEIEFQQTSI